MKESDKDKRNGRLGAALFTTLLLLALVFLGLSYQNPPPELGVEVNFGYDAVGSGTTSSAQQVEEVQQTPTTTTDNPATDVNTDVVTQSNTDAPAVTEQSQTSEQQTEQQQRQPDSRLTDALSSTRNGQGEGEGEDPDGGGDQGNPNGNPNSDSRSGNSASGNGGDYRLGGRVATVTPDPEYQCGSDEGTVVVKVYVNRSGVVTRAEAGDAIPNGPATTTTSSCLYGKAEAAARATRWSSSSSAPEEQIGYIIYNFQKN
ncbi:MAG: hypothetical protein HWD92_05025 [Flavobacteriia bacterium]|nr:hypothetical protein [Flavobacteriia bacterium]